MMTKIRSIHRVFRYTAIAASFLCVALAARADQYATTVLGDSPVAYWQLNETSGSVAQDSAGSFTGSYTNVLVDQPGYQLGSDPTDLAAGFGSPAGFSQNSYVGGMALDFATNANAVFTLEAWVNGGGQTSGAGIVGKGTGGSQEECYLDCGASGGAFRFFVRNAAGTASTANSTFLPDGAWHHLVGVCDERISTISLYIDGQLAATASASGGIRTSANTYMNIGARQSAATGPFDFQFNGYISDVAVYRTALSAAQVQNHYFAAGIPPKITQDTVATLQTNENSPVTLTVAAYGNAPFSYQWILGSTPLSGETNATFFTNSIPASYNGFELYLQVSNAYGVANSQGTFLTVYSGAPTFAADLQPSTLMLYPGSAFNYSVTAVGTAPITYQWYKNLSPISGATNSTYTATASAGSDQYMVTASNGYNGGSSANSSTVSLTGAPLPAGSYATHILADHPMAYWRLDETNGSVANDFAGGHTGTYNNVLQGLPGYSPSQDADFAIGVGSVASEISDSYMQENDQSSSGLPLIDFSQPTGSNAEFSIECWVNGPAGQNPSGSCIVAKGITGNDEFVLDASSGNGNDFRLYTRKPGSGGTSIINSSTGPDGNWHHLVAVCDEANGVTQLYIDGSLNSQITGLGNSGLYSSSIPISIGAQNSGPDYDYQFNGVIDEVSVYNYALTAAQVQAHYNAAPLPPYFTVQPPTNIASFLGQQLTLSATVLGSAPMTNQWYSNNVALAGQTNVSLTVNTSHTGTNTYYLAVSNPYGVTNTAGTVVQIPAGSGPPTFLTDTTPASSSRYAGQPLTFLVVASGSTPLHYQWYSNNVAIPGATNSTYAIASLQLSSSANYNCIASNSISATASTVSTLTVVAAPTNIYADVILGDHPVAYFRLDEPANSQNGYDYVGGNVGQYTSLLAANFPQLGVPGYAPTLDPDTACKFGIGGTGVNNTYLGNTISNIDFSVPNGQNGTFSIEAWINGSSTTAQVGGGAILAKGRGSAEEQFSMDINNGIRFYVRNAAGSTLVNAQASPSLTGTLSGGTYKMDGKWHHVVGVCDQVHSNLLLYVDGQLIGPNVITNGVVPAFVTGYDLGVPGTGTNGAIAANAGIEKPTTTQDNVNTTSIGNRNKSSAHSGTGAYDLPFEGVLDEVALYNYVLTPAQVLNHYDIGAGVHVPLTITDINGKAVVSWTGTATLQSSSKATGPWTVVPNATSPYTNTSSTAQFFRLKLH